MEFWNFFAFLSFKRRLSKCILVYKLALFIDIPGVAGAVLQTPTLLIHYLTISSFSVIYSEHLHSQTERARELTF